MKLSPLLFALLSSPFAAQDLCEGNGYGGAYLELGPAYLGGFFSVDLGSPNAPSSLVVLSISDGFNETMHPLLGPVCLDVTSPVHDIVIFPTDPLGNVHFDVSLAGIPSLALLPPFYANAVTFEGGNWSVSKTAPLWFVNPDSWSLVGNMSDGRMYHTATNLGADGKDDRIKIFVAGGGGGTITVPQASDTTDLFDPLSHTFESGPTMMVERATHTATRLHDGRVLIAGGLDDLGVCHASCEIYDRATDTLTPTGSMTAPRAGHTATLLDDGRVLVTGGFADYQNPSFDWMTALNSAQNTAEIYDPITGMWTPLAQPMASKRAGHTATKLQGGKVMLINGISGGGIGSIFAGNTVPVFTATVDLFDPATATFSALPEHLVDGSIFFGGSAFHGVNVLGDGRVLVTGGVYHGGPNGEAISTRACSVWDGSTWTQVGLLPTPMAWHSQVTLDNGKALILGGLEATGAFDLAPKSSTLVHDGTAVTSLNTIGFNPALGPVSDPRGAMTVTRMHDGQLFLCGGWIGSGTSALADGYVYTPSF